MYFVPGLKLCFVMSGIKRMPVMLRGPATQPLCHCIYAPQRHTKAGFFPLRYPWQTEERLAAEAALRAMGVVTARMGGNLASSGNQDGQAQAAPISDGKAPSPDNLLEQSPPSDALAAK